MERKFIDIYDKFSSHIDLGMSIDVDVFFEDNKKVQEYIAEINDKDELLIKIKLHEYSTILAEELFYDFVNFAGYRYVNFFVRNETEKATTYLYITAMDDLDVTKMKVTIE